MAEMAGRDEAPDEASGEPRARGSLFEAPPLAEQERMVEAILFATAEPVGIADLNARMPHGCDAAAAIEQLRKRYEGRGVAVVKVGDAWAMRTAPDLGFLSVFRMIDNEWYLVARSLVPQLGPPAGARSAAD